MHIVFLDELKIKAVVKNLAFSNFTLLYFGKITEYQIIQAMQGKRCKIFTGENELNISGKEITYKLINANDLKYEN